MIVQDGDLLKPPLHQDLVEGFEMSWLLVDEVLQFVDAGNLRVSGSGVHRALLALFPEPKDLIGDFVVGLFVMGLFEKLLLEVFQSFVNAVSGILLSTAYDFGDVLLELCLICRLIPKEPVNRLNYYIFQYRLIDRSGMAFLAGGFQLADAAPDDGLAAAVVPVNAPEHLTAVPANDDLGEAVIAAVAALLAVGAGLDHSPANQLFLHPEEDILRNDCFMVPFHIVLRNDAIVLNSGFIQKVGGVCLLQQGIADVFLVSQDLVDGAGPPLALTVKQIVGVHIAERCFT